MAVVQISKIQLRRGKKLVTGLPQLASGELAWAIDTQELYIGNGAVSEGAPAVGNTKILTTNDSLLDLLEQYQYKPNDETVSTGLDGPTERTLQARLDEGAVNAASFNISGLDSSVDQTTNIQNAIYSLYLTTSTANRVRLEFDPGVYTLTGTVYVPSNVQIIGSGKEQTVFNFVKGGINPATNLTLAGTSITTAGSYTNLSTTTVTGTGTGAIVSVVKTGTGAAYSNLNTTITIVNCGSGYAVGNQIKVLGSALGGSSPANDLTITLGSTALNPVFNTSTVFEFINETSTTSQRNVSPTLYATQAKNIVFENFKVATNSNSVRPFNFINVRDSIFSHVRVTGTWDDDGDIALSRALEMTASTSLITCQRNMFVNFEADGFSYGVFSNTDIINNTFKDCRFANLEIGVGLGIDAGISAIGPRNNTIINSMFDTINQQGIFVDKGYGNRSRGNTFVAVGNDGGSSALYGHIKFTTSGNSSSQDNFSDRIMALASANFGSQYTPEIEGKAYWQETMPTTISLGYTPTVVQGFRLPLNATSSFEVNYVFQSSVFSQMRKGTLHIAVDRTNLTVQLVDEYEYAGTPGQDSRIIFSAAIITVGSGINSRKTVAVYYTNLNTSDSNTFTYTVNALS